MERSDINSLAECHLGIFKSGVLLKIPAFAGMTMNRNMKGSYEGTRACGNSFWFFPSNY